MLRSSNRADVEVVVRFSHALVAGLVALAVPFQAVADVAKGIGLLEQGDIQGSVKEFQAAFEASEPDGAFYIGRLFELGLGTELDMGRAVELYAAAASRGSALARNRLGLMHLNGEFVLQDYGRAAELICAAADQGDANGQFNCGLLYLEGKGVERNAGQAVTLWKEAAGSRHVAAINFLGQAYRDGTGVDRDEALAFAQFSITASAGNPLGLYEVAKASARGLGTGKDPVKAHAYANLAAVRGMTDAAALRDEIAATLAPQDLAQAQAMAREWKAVPLTPAQ
uniref:Sel1 repeat family protein n=1 Tax=Agrobacterium albertimagni TaxID=147266 RepID=A0A7C1T334_9HYPH